MDDTKTALGYNMLFVGLGASRIKSIELDPRTVKVVYHPAQTRMHCRYGEDYVRERYGWQRIGCSSQSTRADGCHVEVVGIGQ